MILTTNEDILNFLESCILDDFLTRDNCKRKILDQLPDDVDFSFDYGATKAVIIPKESDFVIKIPLNRDVDGNFYIGTLSRYTSSIVPDSCFWNYCFEEEKLYQDFKEYQVEDFFAKTEFVGLVHGYPIYKQEKADTLIDYHYLEDYEYEEKLDKSSSVDFCLNHSHNLADLDLEWVEKLEEILGEQESVNFLSFLDENVNDLHVGNIGYRKGFPIIIDYSGFMG